MSKKHPRPGLSIRYKFLFVTTLLLTLSVSAYLFLASHIFRSDKTELVYDLTRSVVANRSTELETLLVGVTDKMKAVALLSASKAADNHAIIHDIFQNDKDLVFMGTSHQFEKIDDVLFADPVFTQTYSTTPAYYTTTLLQKRPIPFDEIKVDGEAIWNATIDGGPPLIGYGKNVLMESANHEGAPFAMIAYIRADHLLRSLLNERSTQVFVTNDHGQILLDADPLLMKSAALITDHPLFQSSHENAVKTGVAEFTYRGQRWLGAHSRSFHNKIVVMSQVSGEKAFSAVTRLLARSLLFGLIVLTLAFIAAILFSRTLTKPIQALIGATKSVAEGNLKTEIPVKSRDEIAILAKSFNTMIRDLRQSREQLEQINRDLEKKVIERTQKLAEQNQAVKKAQEALLQSTRLAAVGEIAGRAAHEVLNPLTSILTRLEKVRIRLNGDNPELSTLEDISQGWVKDYTDGGFQKLVETWQTRSKINQQQTLWEEDLQNLEQARSSWRTWSRQLLSDTDFLLKEGQRINKIVQNMRMLTVVKGHVEIKSIHGLLHEAKNIMADLAEGAKIEIAEDFSASADQVEIDSDEFIQSTTNLIRNSIQAIRARTLGESKGQILLHTRQESSILLIDIEDNGIGIDPENQVRLFESQFSTKSPEEGTGLGLSISRRFIRAYGGDIFLLESKPNQKTVFRIQLPLKENDQQGEIAV